MLIKTLRRYIHQTAAKGISLHAWTGQLDYYYFYMDSVDASAAYLTDEDDMVIARCIIYNEVKDQDGNKWRLAERQYASDENDILKRALIDALIKGDTLTVTKSRCRCR